ncbi:hypothetical protein QMZ05_12560 [Bradyrhizobium sp. INPA03-11B]|uniref:hypothetical protein n=1 Tax=Bradyrhizobium sp. INPA03-11B TaxID=418598 RepID=UPI00338E4CA0
MTDRYLGQSPTLGDCYISAAAVALSDSAMIETTRALWVGSAGNVNGRRLGCDLQ